MRHPFAALTLILATVTAVTLVPEFARAQGKSEQAPPKAAPVKPYKPLAVTPPGPYTDPGFAAFRKQLGDLAQHKDRAGLAKLVVAQGFFWIQDKDLADKHKPGIDNLAKAIDLDAKDGSGWDVLAGYANEPTASPFPERQGVICAPANPPMDSKAFQALLQSTQTDPSEWAYPLKDGVEVRGAAQPNAPVVDKLGGYLVRVLADSAPSDNASQARVSARRHAFRQNRFRPVGCDHRARRRRNVLQQGRERLEDCRLFRRRRRVRGRFEVRRPRGARGRAQALERAALSDDNVSRSTQAGRTRDKTMNVRCMGADRRGALLYPFSAGVGAGSIAGLSLLQADDRGRRARRRPRNSNASLPEQFQRQAVYYRSQHPAGTVVVETSERHLYLIEGPTRALRYGIGVGRDGFTWQGLLQISRKSEWPDWHPPPEMIERQPYLPRFMAGGPGNPLGARAMHLGNTVYRIHGTNAPETIGHAVSSGLLPPGQR